MAEWRVIFTIAITDNWIHLREFGTNVSRKEVYYKEGSIVDVLNNC